MQALCSSTTSTLDEELHGMVTAVHQCLGVLCEDSLVQPVGAKRSTKKEGTTAAKEGAYKFHIHKVCKGRKEGKIKRETKNREGWREGGKGQMEGGRGQIEGGRGWIEVERGQLKTEGGREGTD